MTEKMKTLTILMQFLAIVTASYPVVETLIYSQIDQILNHENHTDPALIPCLEIANDFVLGGIFVDEQKKIGNAIFPSPSGNTNWTLEELTNSAIYIIDRMRSNAIKNMKSKSILNHLGALTLEELDKALEQYPLPHKVDQTDEFINLHILETLHTVMSEVVEGKFDAIKDTLMLLVPAVDISMWAVDDLKDAIDNSDVKPELTHYLKEALSRPSQSLDDGKTYCVVTPVGLIPQVDNYYYIPKATKDLIRISKIKPQSLPRRSTKEARLAATRTVPLRFH